MPDLQLKLINPFKVNAPLLYPLEKLGVISSLWWLLPYSKTTVHQHSLVMPLTLIPVIFQAVLVFRSSRSSILSVSYKAANLKKFCKSNKGTYSKEFFFSNVASWVLLNWKWASPVFIPAFYKIWNDQSLPEIN